MEAATVCLLWPNQNVAVAKCKNERIEPENGATGEALSDGKNIVSNVKHLPFPIFLCENAIIIIIIYHNKQNGFLFLFHFIFNNFQTRTGAAV